MDTLFLVEADPTTISENGSLKDPQLRVYKIGKPVLRPENVHSRIQKRCYKKWPYFRPESGDFSGFISDIVFGSASTRQKRAHFRLKPSLTMAYPNPKMRSIFGSRNQTGSIGSTTLTVKPELAVCFLNKVLAKNNDQRRSIDHVRIYVLARVRCTRASQPTRR